MIPTQPALEARANLEWVASKWGDLQRRLRKSGGDPNAPRVAGSKEQPAPIDLHVSDLMHEITTAAVLWGRILIEESDWQQGHGSMPGLLLDVASQFGHFVTDQDERVAWDFCDAAHEFRRKVEGVLEPRGPRRYIGPCFAGDCQAELYLRAVEPEGVCGECGAAWTLEGQVRGAYADMMSLLMEKSEITRTLKILGYEVRDNLVHEWASGKSPRLKPKQDGLYSLGEAIRLIKRKGKRGARPPALSA